MDNNIIYCLFLYYKNCRSYYVYPNTYLLQTLSDDHVGNYFMDISLTILKLSLPKIYMKLHSLIKLNTFL